MLSINHRQPGALVPFLIATTNQHRPNNSAPYCSSTMAPLAILTPMLLLSQSVLGFGLPGYSARETAYHNYRPGEGRYSPPPHHPRSSPPSMVADGVWDILKWQGYFLTQCLDTGSSDDDNDYDGGGCPRGGRFAEVAWYRNQSRSCVDSGDRRRPDCQRLGDVGWVGDRAGVRWEAEPGDLVG